MRSLLLLLALLSIVAARADDSLQSVLDNHLRSDVAYWLDEPRLFTLLRDNNQRNAALSSDEIGALEARWQQEIVADDGELSEHMLSRFASKYLAEVSLRMDGAYGRVIALDNRGLVAAARGRAGNDTKVPGAVLVTGVDHAVGPRDRPPRDPCPGNDGHCKCGTDG